MRNLKYLFIAIFIFGTLSILSGCKNHHYYIVDKVSVSKSPTLVSKIKSVEGVSSFNISENVNPQDELSDNLVFKYKDKIIDSATFTITMENGDLVKDVKVGTDDFNSVYSNYLKIGSEIEYQDEFNIITYEYTLFNNEKKVNTFIQTLYIPKNKNPKYNVGEKIEYKDSFISQYKLENGKSINDFKKYKLIDSGDKTDIKIKLYPNFNKTTSRTSFIYYKNGLIPIINSEKNVIPVKSSNLYIK